jgi:hypothetical protein
MIRAYSRHPRFKSSSSLESSPPTSNVTGDSAMSEKLVSRSRHLQSSRVILLLAVALFAVDPPAFAQPKARSSQQAPPRRITIENLISAAPLPAQYSVSRENFLNGDKVVGHKLLVTRDGVVSKVIAQIENRKLATDDDKRAAAKDYVLGIMQSFHRAGLRTVEKKLPEIAKSDFKKREFADFIYERPEDGSRLFVQMQLFFTDRGYTVLVISDNAEDHTLLTRWARSVLPK